MLNHKVVKDFLSWEFENLKMEMPRDISEDVLVETFCKYVEDDYYEWLKDNFKSFFDHGNPNWNWIRGRIEHDSQDD